jgi:hypothetical protein
MPTPRKGEQKSAYISRCIRYCVDSEGMEQKAAVGKCYGMWDYYTKNNVTEKIHSIVEGKGFDKRDFVKGFLDMPIGDYINLCAEIEREEVEEQGTTTQDIDITTTASNPKRKKRKESMMRRRLQDTSNSL